MSKIETIRGRVAAFSQVEQFTKRNGQMNVKCVYHIIADDGRELAVTATGDLTLYVGEQDARVEVEYICRVFPFERGGRTLYGNDVYAKSIRRI